MQIGVPINLGFNYSREFKQVYEDVVDERDTHFYEYFLEDVGGYVDLNLSDRIHPNKAGYEIIANNIYDFLKDENLVK